MTDALFAEILRREAGVTSWGATRARKHPADRGGWTRGGVTAYTLGRWKGFTRPATREELDALTESEARAIYAERYVAPWDWIADPLRLLLIDWGITTSHKAVTMAVQRALVDLGCDPGPIDGIAGPKTKAAIAGCREQAALYRAISKARIGFYLQLGFSDQQTRDFLHANPDVQLHFLRGWVKRALEFVL